MPDLIRAPLIAVLAVVAATPHAGRYAIPEPDSGVPPESNGVVPVIAPVAAGDDPALLDGLLDPAPAAERVISGVSAVPVDATDPVADSSPAGADPGSVSLTDPAGPWDLAGDLGAEELLPPERAIDPCAVDDSAPGCGIGYAVTIGGPALPPDPFMFAAEGHEFAVAPAPGQPWVCPAGRPIPGPGQTAITVWSVTPLTELLVEWRPFRSSAPWQSLAVEPPTSPATAAAWLERLETEAYDRATWGLLPTCLVITRDRDRAYEVRTTATDTFGRTFEGNGLATLRDASPAGRPPTVARFARGAGAVVDAWTTEDGSVRFTSRLLTDPSDLDCRHREATTTYRPGVLHSPASPLGVWDPRFHNKVTYVVPMAPGGLALVCATIFDTANPLRPLGTDALLVRAPAQPRPTVSLEAVRLDSGEVVDELTVGVHDGRAYSCTTAYYHAPTPLIESATIGTTLWDCRDRPLPPAAGDTLTLRVDLSAVSGGTVSSTTRAITVHADDCGSHLCVRLPTWHELALPGDIGGAAILKVSYPVEGASTRPYGEAATVATSDRGADPTSGVPNLYLSFRGPLLDAATLTYTEPVTLHADRPITVRELRLEGPRDAEPGCGGSRTFPVPGGPATDFDATITGLCPRTRYEVQATVNDAAGADHVVALPAIPALVHLIGEGVHTTVELDGGTGVPVFGRIFDLGVYLDGQPATGRFWSYSSGGTFTGRDCVELDGTVIQPTLDPFIDLEGAALDVVVRLDIPSGGPTGCDRPTPSLRRMELRGTLTLAQLAAGTAVISTPPDAPLQVRVTITAERWAPPPG